MEENITPEKKYSMYSPLTLAYIGDGIFDLKIRDYMVRHHNMQVEKFHKRVSGMVRAVNQAAFMDEHMEMFTEEELQIYQRGRNASVHTKARHATMEEYKKATGLEAILGYLHLIGRTERIEEIVRLVLKDAGELVEEV